MNFDHINKVSDYVRENLMPHMRTLVPLPDFGNYLLRISECPSCKWMKNEIRILPINYFVDPEAFMKKYAKMCVSFSGTGAPQEGAFCIIYQITPTFHVLARLYHWVENNDVKAYLMLACAYRDHKEYLEFFDGNKDLRCIGDTEEKQLGFAGMMRQGSEFDDIIKTFSSNKEEQGDKGQKETS